MEGGGRKLQKGAHTIFLPAQHDCSTLGIVRKQLHPREKLLALYLQIGNIWEGKGPKMVLVLIAKQYSVRTIYIVLVCSLEGAFKYIGGAALNTMLTV